MEPDSLSFLTPVTINSESFGIQRSAKCPLLNKTASLPSSISVIQLSLFILEGSNLITLISCARFSFDVKLIWLILFYVKFVKV